ncbi:hypothetical protein C5B42_03140 [Candidatus Cerribacteria bacterium 'Amazon FNV 2010 28 9']|uniref:Uncharacterized protein n=1 Tax=Candidatus Cerribacteria bacterium 'Amazon FNV 2010 28 9' TaxID=2081795 RepID=A0A317JPZ3_9BACT|nr:MAG: hypothetical protein C5B42_03140 [Candidatus Cerribacteria bacterium 'Amazon FNV 2010 28 9']
MDPQKISLNPDTTPEIEQNTMGELPASEENELPSGENHEKVEHVPPISISFNTNGAGDTLMATQGIINRQAARLDELKEEIKHINESLRSILENDAELSQAEEQLKEVTKRQKARKQQIANNAESTQLKFKLKETRDQVKELEESLNNHLLNYYQITGTKVFDTDDGAQREFKITARVMAKKQS